jgi:hypothetical protein
VAQTIERGGVDPIHSMVQSSMNGRNRVAVILRTHASFPTTPADRPSANSDWSDMKIAIAQLSGFHSSTSPGQVVPSPIQVQPAFDG